MKSSLHTLVLLLAGTGLCTTTTQAAITPIDLPGSSENYNWSFNRANYDPGVYGRYLDWTAFSTDQPSVDTVFLNTTSTADNFIPAHPGPDGLAGLGSLLILSDTAPQAGLQTIVLQLDYRQLGTPLFSPGSANLFPVLKIGGLIFGTDGRADFFQGNDLVGVPHPGLPDLFVDAGQYAWQWDLRDLTGYDLSAGYTIEWNTPGTFGGLNTALLTGIQLDQGTEFAQAVPEASAYAALFGVGALSLVLWRRRATPAQS